MEIHIALAPERLFQLGPIAVTNSMFTMFIVMALIIIVGNRIARNAKLVPTHGQSIFEMIAEFLLELVESTGGKRLGRQVYPLVAALFIFIALANYTGVLPGIGTIYLKESVPAGEHAALEVASVATAPAIQEAAVEGETNVPGRLALFRPPNADLNMTLAMSVLTFVVVQIAGIRAHGPAGRIKHMAEPVFLFPIEVISEFSRIISLSARLFGNVFAGEVLLGVIYAMVSAIKIAVIPLVLPVVFIGLELLFGTIQALVFALLTLIYIYLAAAGHDDHEAAHTDAHHPAVTPGAAPAGAAD